ncbi:MAG: 50S ribosomal protein L11 methyltransferase [Flavobacteriaceae bacterium]
MVDNYLEYSFTVRPRQPATNILIAELDSLGFESFLETPEGLLAYIKKADQQFDNLDEVNILRNADFDIEHSVKEIDHQNWNQEWESSFEPILLGHHCAVRAPFHPKPEVKYDIVITPKMSFGTGHHETTHMMLQFVLKNDIQGKSVLDMGCGTAVLAILASMRGASKVDAIDIDHWSFLNAQENVKLNHQEHIRVREGDVGLLEGEKYDIILANINRNALLRDIPHYVANLKRGGILLLSGFYKEDLPVISEKCAAYELSFQENLENNDWVSAKYVF